MFFREFAKLRPTQLVEEDKHRAANTIHSGAEYRRRCVLLRKLTSLVLGVATLASTPVYGAPGDDLRHWTGTWSAAPETVIGAGQYADQTLRLIVHTSIRGSRLRVRISNTFGTDALLIGAAHLALRDAGARIVQGTDRELSFSGTTAFTIPAGALALSDPVYLDVPALTDVAISLYFPVLSTASTTHTVANQTNYIANSNGDFTGRGPSGSEYHGRVGLSDRYRRVGRLSHKCCRNHKRFGRRRHWFYARYQQAMDGFPCSQAAGPRSRTDRSSKRKP